MKKQIIIILSALGILLLLGITLYFTQGKTSNLSSSAYTQAQVELTGEAFAYQEATLYYYTAHRTDSLKSWGDEFGKVVFTLPVSNYKGMIKLSVPNSGSIEAILAESVLKVECKGKTMDRANVRFPGSNENELFAQILAPADPAHQTHAQGWWDAREKFFASPIGQAGESPLYAAKYQQLIHFFHRLSSAEVSRDVDAIKAIQHEMETTLDLEALYHTGELWNSVHCLYALLFHDWGTEQDPAKESAYSQTILRTMERLEQPYRNALLAVAITETNRFGLQEAQRTLLSYSLSKDKYIELDNADAQRLVGQYRNENIKLDTEPAIHGLPATDKQFEGGMLVAFYTSDCGSCVVDMKELATIYPQIAAKNIRVVSISADRTAKLFNSTSGDYPWADKLCDYQGYDGLNFTNYAVRDTPTYFLLDKKGKKLGVYYAASAFNFMK